MNEVAVGALVVVVAAFAVVLLVAWDRLVGTALVGVFAGASWFVTRAAGRWWFWPAVVVAVVAVIAAFVGAVLIS